MVGILLEVLSSGLYNHLIEIEGDLVSELVDPKGEANVEGVVALDLLEGSREEGESVFVFLFGFLGPSVL
jgi:hypothetical protein